MKNLTLLNVVGIGVSWAGAAVIAYISNDGFVAFICVCAAYYLAKWIIFGRNEED